MIEIINATPHHSVTKEVICRNCGVTLRYTPHDVQKRTVSDYGGGRDVYNYIKCPNCCKEIGV